jgi:serine protease inhibitor
MESHANTTGLWSRLQECFRRTPPSDEAQQLRSDVNQCISFLRTARRREGLTEVTGTLTASARTCNAFGWRLLHCLAEPQTENVFISPCGILLTLAMIYNGARGETEQVIAKTLGLDSTGPEEMNQQNKKLVVALMTATEDAEVCLATSLWAKHPDRMQLEFIQNCQEYYDAEVRDLEEGPDAINAWVSRHTHGLIDGIVGEIDPEVHALLVNAVYFHNKWETPFLPEATRDWPFTLTNGRKMTCKMMMQDDNYLYLRTKQFRAARLPYRDGFRMVVFLPHPEVSLTAMLALLSPENWESWSEQFYAADGTVGLPRFRFDYFTNLKKVLTRMGMAVAFDPDCANFSGMSPDFCIGNVLHRAFVEVNEEGTRAAAATLVEALCTGVKREEPEERFTLILDRPFCCAIEDEQTGALLFLGVVLTP